METFKPVLGVPTKVICNGKNIEEDLSAVNFMVLVIPGNPGIVDYYREFMTKLYRDLAVKYPDEIIPVWGICHSGHQTDDLDPKLFPAFKGNENLYSLEGQFKHKCEFIKTYIPSHVKVIGIGHSIGCKTWSEVIKRFELAKNVASNGNGHQSAKTTEAPEIAKCFMLFPTLERMRATPNGRWGQSLLPYWALIEPLLKLIMMMPTVFHKMVLKMIFFGRDVPKSAINVSLQLFNPDIYRKIFFMAKCELEQVWELDADTLLNNLDKLFFYFGKTDGWMPLEFVEDMKNMLPKMKYQVCEKGVEHAFVIKDSVFMAETICSLIDITSL